MVSNDSSHLRTFKPLAGIKILSFELAFSLPAGTRALHDLGADVVRVSPPERQQDRYISVIDGVFHGKPCISIDLTLERGRHLAHDLALEADVVCNNFRPNVMPKYGLDGQSLRSRKPELVWLQLSGYGTPGPWSNFPAFGPSTEAAGGLNRLLADAGERPFRINTGVFADQLSGRHAALAVVAALRKRQQTGEGATIDLSMTACITHLLGQAMTRASLGESMPPFRGNRDPRFAPQGIYRAAGQDEWVSISVTSDAAWRRLSEIIADDRLDPNQTLEGRRAAHDHIDAIIQSWTRGKSKDAVTEVLQQAGIAAAPVRTVADSALDPQFLARGSLQPVRHRKPKLGYKSHPHPPLPWRVVGRQRRRVTDYRHTGQDNARVLRNWLGIDEPEIAELHRSGVLSKEPPLNLQPREAIPNRDPDYATKLGLPE